MRHLDLFSGIGGFALAAQWVWGKEHEIVSFVEIDPFCQAVLKKHWPDVPIHSDIKDFNGTAIANTTSIRPPSGIRKQPGSEGEEIEKRWVCESQGEDSGAIDLLTGGFPCQPYSCAGKRRGAGDDRALWPEMYRVIRETRPRWIVGENVAGFINLGLDQSIADLEMEGYTVQTFIIPACAVNAPHRRDRVWIVANSGCEHGTGTEKSEKSSRPIYCPQDAPVPERSDCHAPDTEIPRLERMYTKGSGLAGRWPSECYDGNFGRWTEGWIEVAARLCRVDDGIPFRVDRLKSLGNAIVPQVAACIMQAIKEVDEMSKERNQ